ncbi:MAG: hypothetical protein PUB20_03345 [Clostridia bacterium]|nr:hypothetical protein [Clostridia bacterium]
MEIQSIGKDKFAVALSRSDMIGLDITYDGLDGTNAQTKRVILIILDAVRRKTGREVDPTASILIEAVPTGDYGCLLIFTLPAQTSGKGAKLSRRKTVRIAEFENIDALLDVLNVLDDKTQIGGIYTNGKKYRAEFPALSSAQMLRIIGEYGKVFVKNELVEAYTKEHWERLNPL